MRWGKTRINKINLYKSWNPDVYSAWIIQTHGIRFRFCEFYRVK